MPTAIRELHLPDGKRIFVEVDIGEGVDLPPIAVDTGDLPPGAEPTGVLEDAALSMKLFQESIAGMAESVYTALKHLQPAEWTVEMSVGFKGKAPPIPFISVGDLEGALKVSVTWRANK